MTSDVPNIMNLVFGHRMSLIYLLYKATLLSDRTKVSVFILYHLLSDRTKDGIFYKDDFELDRILGWVYILINL